jgi:hypothetical protein
VDPWIPYYDDQHDQHKILILDHEWYVDNQPELEEWMQHNLHHGRDSLLGYVITFASQSELNWFLLRWL